MRKGEKGILIVIAVIVVVFAVINNYRMSQDTSKDEGIPFYSSASQELQSKASLLYRELKCRDCHTLWGVRNPMQAVPAPSLDGIGSLRDEAWLYDYLSTEDPQAILPSRLKDEYKMPSYASISEDERRTLATYLSSLKVKDWYLEEARKSHYEKLTGNEYQLESEQSHE